MPLRGPTIDNSIEKIRQDENSETELQHFSLKMKNQPQKQKNESKQFRVKYLLT